MKRIYIILTHTGTTLSKIIKSYTKDEFSHVSIALDVMLEEMYSFGRVHPYNPFWGGFVHEKINEGIYKRFKKTTSLIYSLEITDDQYERVNQTIRNIESKKKKYNFNAIGLFAVGFNKRIKYINAFYCAEFVKYVLDSAKINLELPEMIKPEDFKKIEDMENANIVYKGLLKDYNRLNKRILLKKIKEKIQIRKKESWQNESEKINSF